MPICVVQQKDSTVLNGIFMCSNLKNYESVKLNLGALGRYRNTLLHKTKL